MISILREKIFYGWVVVAGAFLLSIIGMGARYSFGVFLKSIETEFAMTRGVTSGIFSVYMLLCCAFAVSGGWALDRYGPKKVGIFMGIFTGFSLVITSMVHSYWQLLFTYSLLLAMGTGPTYGVANTTASRWFVKKRGLALGITGSGGGVGAIVLAPVATYLISNYDWRTAFVVLGIVLGIALIAVSLLLEKDPRDMGLFPDGARSELERKETQKKAAGTGSVGFSLGEAMKMNQFWLLALSWVFMSLSLHMVFVHVVPYAIDTGISPMDAAFIMSLIGLTNIPGRIITGQISDAFGRKTLAIASSLIMVVALLWLMWAQELWALYAFAMVFGFLWGGGGTMIAALIGDIFGTKNLGPIMGWMSAAWALGAAIGPAIGGYIFDVSGRYFTAFGAGAVAILITACLVAFIRSVPKGNAQGLLK
ncbi:MFS transporter [Thermodesulfobacteriota bacterium]